MAGKDKVKFGIKNVHYALLTDETTPTFETPVAIPGAVSLSLEANGDSSSFHADDMQYFVTIVNNGIYRGFGSGFVPFSVFGGYLWLHNF